jgi:hypothetical protein
LENRQDLSASHVHMQLLSVGARCSHGGIGGGNGGDDIWGGWNGGGWNGGEGNNEWDSSYSSFALWDKYNEALDQHPIPTKAVTSLVGFT